MNFIFPEILGISNHPNWRTHIVQRGGPTTNQTITGVKTMGFLHQWGDSSYKNNWRNWIDKQLHSTTWDLEVQRPTKSRKGALWNHVLEWKGHVCGYTPHIKAEPNPYFFLIKSICSSVMNLHCFYVFVASFLFLTTPTMHGPRLFVPLRALLPYSPEVWHYPAGERGRGIVNFCKRWRNNSFTRFTPPKMWNLWIMVVKLGQMLFFSLRTIV